MSGVTSLNTDKLDTNVIFCGLAVLFALTLYYSFDFRVDLGGDNAAYVFRAYMLLNEGVFPSYQGPLYPMILVPLIWLFGIDIIILKSFSAFALIISFVLIFFTFRHKYRRLVLFAFLIILTTTSDYVFFGSKTYSEAFFILIQSSFFLFVLRSRQNNSFSSSVRPKGWKTDLIKCILYALICLLMGLTRSIGYSSVICLCVFFLLTKQARSLMYFVFSFSILFGVYQLMLSHFVDSGGDQLLTQPSQFLLKNPYHPQSSNEDLIGFILRFYENSNFYIGKVLFALLGIEVSKVISSVIVSVAVWLMLVVYAFYSWKENRRCSLLISIYCIVSLFVEFILLHTFWQQTRLIIPYYPFLIIIILDALNLTYGRLFIKSSNLLIVFFIVVIIFSLKSNVPRYNEAFGYSQSHRDGDIYAGYHQSWINFFDMSSYVGRNIPSDIGVLSRKPGLSFLFGKRIFNGLYRFPYANISEFEGENLLVLRTNDYVRFLKGATNNILREKLIGFFYAAQKNNQDGFYENRQYYSVFRLNDEHHDSIINLLKKLNIDFSDDFLNHQNYLDNVSYVRCDQLVKMLFRGNVTYMISENFDGQQNSQTLTDKVSLYLNLKYPGLIETVHTIGKDYPVELLKVDYKTYLDYQSELKNRL